MFTKDELLRYSGFAIIGVIGFIASASMLTLDVLGREAFIMRVNVLWVDLPWWVGATCALVSLVFLLGLSICINTRPEEQKSKKLRTATPRVKARKLKDWRRLKNISVQELTRIVNRCTTKAGVLRELGYASSGTAYRQLELRIKQLGLEFKPKSSLYVGNLAGLVPRKVKKKSTSTTQTGALKGLRLKLRCPLCGQTGIKSRRGLKKHCDIKHPGYVDFEALWKEVSRRSGLSIPQTSDLPTDLITPKEAASLWGCTPPNIYAKIKKGRLTSYIPPDKQAQYVSRSELVTLKQNTVWANRWRVERTESN